MDARQTAVPAGPMAPVLPAEQTKRGALERPVSCSFGKGSSQGAAHTACTSAGGTEHSTAMPGARLGIKSIARSVVLINEVCVLLVWHLESL